MRPPQGYHPHVPMPMPVMGYPRPGQREFPNQEQGGPLDNEGDDEASERAAAAEFYRPPFPYPHPGYRPIFPPPGLLPPHRCPNKCDVQLYKDCTCLSPATYTKDGRGNCNVGASKLDLRVWCYVDPKAGNPEDVCPDALPSKSKKGFYWSRIACITG